MTKISSHRSSKKRNNEFENLFYPNTCPNSSSNKLKLEFEEKIQIEKSKLEMIEKDVAILNKRYDKLKR